MKQILVTGGAGFIGSRLVHALAGKGFAVRVLDNFTSGRIDNAKIAAGAIEVLEGDVRSQADCREACRDVETVFHMAALVSVPQSVADPIGSDSINAGGTLNVLLAARDAGVQRLVFSSSAAIYGDTAVIPVHEDVTPMPTSPYGVQKLTGEHYARNFSRLYGLEIVSLRYFNVYGPGQDPASPYAAAIPKFLTRLLRGEPPTVFGDGEQTRDFCYVDDVVAANLCAATAPSAAAQGSAYNIGCGSRITINCLLPLIQECLGTSLPVRYDPEREGDIKHSGADICAARQALAYEPATALVEGLRQTAKYYRSSAG